jgi:hypothetical protein
VFVQNVSSVLDVRLQAFGSGCCICFTHMLQQYVPNVLSVSVLCCNKYFHIASCKYFDLEVAYVAMPIHVCFKCIF